MPKTQRVRTQVKGLNTKGKPRPKRQKGHLNAMQIAKIERRYQVVRLRRDGHTIGEIACALKVNELTVRQDLVTTMAFVAKSTVETVEEGRQLEVDRLDQLTKTYTPLATQVQQQIVVDRATGQAIKVDLPPNPAYAGLLLSISQRRSKLLALDVPELKKVEVTGVREYTGVDLSKV